MDSGSICFSANSALMPAKSAIQITPTMIAAGETVLLEALGGAVSSHWSPPDLAMKVFLAMYVCDPPKPSQALGHNQSARLKRRGTT
jgi:hypothetical protein